MRRFVWFAVGFAAACAVGVYLFLDNILWIPIAVCLGLSLLLLLGKKTLFRMASLTFAGCFVGFLWLTVFQLAYLSTLTDWSGQTGKWQIRISDYAQESQYGTSAEGRIELDGRNFRVKVFLDQEKQLSPGDLVEGQFSLRQTIGEEKASISNAVGNGIYLYAYQVGDVDVSVGDDSGISYMGAKLRNSIRGCLEEIFPEDTLGFACALLLGDGSLLDYETDTAFSVSGIRHVIAVSGLHISILFSLVYFVSGKSRTGTALLGIPALILFAAVAGFTPSVTRACVMQVLMILAMLVKKDYDGPTSLAFAVFVMLLVNPMAVTSVSLQLSTLCVMGIFLFSGKIRGFLLSKSRYGSGKSVLDHCARWIAGSVSISLSAMVLTTPLCAVYFGTISLVGVFTNLLTLWVVSLVFYGLIVCCLLFCASPALGAIVAAVISFPMRFIVIVAKLLSRIPFAAVYTESVYIVIWLVFSYCLLFVFLLSREKRPLILLSGVIAGLFLSLGASFLEPRLDDFRVTVLDVGQGQCILLQSRDRNYVVDCGSYSGAQAADKAAGMLLSQGVWKLDGLILTHFDSDHSNGVEMLLSRIPADTIYLPQGEGNSDLTSRLKDQQKQNVFLVRKTMTLEFSDVELTIFPGEEGTSENESSMCILFQPQKYDILITGDRNEAGERLLLSQTELPQLDLLVAGHHGAEDATTLALLMQTKPDNVAISVGANNLWGHPHEDVLKRLSWFGCGIYRTDLDGTILYRG